MTASRAAIAVRRALVVGAHPDDAELFAGGTVAGWTAAGVEVAFLICTDGRLGSHEAADDPGEVARVRAEEARRGAERLGVSSLEFLSYADGELAAADAKREIARAIRAFRPEVVLGHDPWRLYETHPDHRAAGAATCDGAVAAREHHALVVDSTPAHRPAELWLFGGDHPDRFVDVEAGIDRKLEALAQHASQFARLPAWRDRVRGWNRRIGAERGLRFAEAFHVLPLAGS